MTTRLSKLVLAAALAASVPAAALAQDHDRDARPSDRDAYGADRDARPSGWDTYGAYPAAPRHAPAATPAPYLPQHDPKIWRGDRPGERSWRDRELREVRAELRALDAERARFYAQYGHRPGKVRKFERWYAARRADLEWRWHQLQRVAWR